MSTRHCGEIEELAGVELFDFGAFRVVHGDPFLDSVAVTGGADHGAAAAAHAFVRPFLPDFRFELDVHQIGQVVDFKGLELAGDAPTDFQVVVVIPSSRLPGFHLLERVEAPIRVDGRKIAVTQIGEVQVEAVGDDVGPHRLAEAAFTRIVVNPYDKGIFSA